jgi:hypothetical protein
VNRLTINISGFEYIGDLYSIEDNVNIKKDFIMIRSLSLIEDSLYNNEIYIIDKDIYTDNFNTIIYPVANEIERYSKNINSFLDSNNLNTTEFYDDKGNIKKLNCNVLKLYHPDTKSNNSNLIVHISTVINNITFHFFCGEYNNLKSGVSTEFSYNHAVYSEYKEIIIPNINDLFNKQTYFVESIFNINIDNSNLIYNKDNTIYESMYLLTIPTYTEINNKTYSSDILNKYLTNNISYPIKLTLYPFSDIEEGFYLPNVDLISNTDIFINSYNIELCGILGFNKNGKLMIKGNFNYNTNMFDSLEEAYNYYNNVNISTYNLDDYTDDEEHNDIDELGNTLNKKYNFSYILELASDIQFRQIIYRSQNIANNTLKDTLSNVSFDIPVFNNWAQLPDLLVGRIIFTDRYLNYSIYSNFIVITNDYYKFIVSSDSRKIYSAKLSNMNNINFNNKVNCIIQKNIVNDNTLNISNNVPKVIYKPVFYKVQDLQNIQIRQGLTQNIGINLNNYMSKVETFILTIDGINFIEHARNDFFVIFKIQANKLLSTGGAYHISNQDNEYISSGNWTLI